MALRVIGVTQNMRSFTRGVNLIKVRMLYFELHSGN